MHIREMIKTIIELLQNMPPITPVFVSIFALLLSLSSLLKSLFGIPFFYPQIPESDDRLYEAIRKLTDAEFSQSLQEALNAITEYINAEYGIERAKIWAVIYRLSKNPSEGLSGEMIATSYANSSGNPFFTTSIKVENNSYLKSLVFDKKPFIFIGDTKTYDKITEFNNQNENWASCICVPIQKDDEIIGTIIVAISDSTMENKVKNEKIISVVELASNICGEIMDDKAEV